MTRAGLPSAATDTASSVALVTPVSTGRANPRKPGANALRTSILTSPASVADAAPPSYCHRMDLLSRISVDPEVRFGKPCVRGTRISVGEVLGYLASGMSEAQLRVEFPQLAHEKIGRAHV